MSKIRYAIYDKFSGRVISIHENCTEATNFTNETEVVYPIISKEDYDKYSTDYKGDKNGVPYILYNGENGTTYGPVLFKEDYQDDLERIKDIANEDMKFFICNQGEVPMWCISLQRAYEISLLDDDCEVKVLTSIQQFGATPDFEYYLSPAFFNKKVFKYYRQDKPCFFIIDKENSCSKVVEVVFEEAELFESTLMHV
ncbi:hypothetical protein CN931_28410 [Bacillus sp. AFS054943]|uniref:Uncharacterized protein n=1 Tax=Bacillus cereus TaxID=1396 RepID=A0A2C1LFU0_BACCE|nr:MULTISPECIES: hypothetical protein [Bacillus]PGL74971.1 hypothetical protein CN931_28410 [Bacillus sp. AFS054943]PGT97347.1 hypothetical protein COD19_25435 [Bacillus cereus]